MAEKQQIADIHKQLREDMIAFGRVIMPNMFTVKSPKFHYEMADAFMNDDIRKINVVAPRGHAKSSIGACVYPLWHLFYEPGKKLIVLSSKTQGHAIELLQSIKDTIEYSMPLRKLFGYWGMHSAKVWTKDRVILKNGSGFICKGTGQQVRGLKFGNQRPTLFIIDDPEDENNTKTTSAMEWNLRWLLQSCEPSLDAQRGKIMVIGTPQHEKCMVETLGKMRDWKSFRYKALQDNGKSLWKELHPPETLKAKKKSLEDINRVSVFYREYQCEVVGDEDQLIKENEIKRYDGYYKPSTGRYGTLYLKELDGEKYNPPIEKHVYVFIGIDPASSTKQTADYSTIVPVAIDSEDNRYVLPYYRKHAKPMDLAKAILEYDTRYRPQKAHVESVGYQEMLRDFINRERFIPGFGTKVNPRTSKSRRLESLQPWFFQRKVYLLKNMEDMVNELLLYPRGSHDDLLDGLYYSFFKAYKPHDQEQESQEQESYSQASDFNWKLL